MQRCQCGRAITFSNEDRCEDCYAAAQQRYQGKATRVKTPFLSHAEVLRQEIKSKQNPLNRGVKCTAPKLETLSDSPDTT